MIYFDYSATTPIDEEALEVYQQISSHVFGNTSSLHDIGSEADHILQVCRKELADILDVSAESIYFTSGGTESNLLSIISLAKSHSHLGKHIITSIAEHPSVHSAMTFLEEIGFEISKIPFTADGMIDLFTLQENIREDTILISLQHVNSEIGTIQPIKEVFHMIQGQKIIFHCDCVQSFGKLDMKEVLPYVDCLTISSHKIYGPKGVGAIYINPSNHVKPVFSGFHHENGFRGGTVNLPGIAGFVASTKKALKQEKIKKYQSLRLLFLELINNDHITLYQSTAIECQLPHIIGLGINGIEGQYVMLECNRNGFAISTGNACHVGQQEQSNTMKAMRIQPSKSQEFVRISMGNKTDECNVKALADLLNKIAEENLAYTN